jgi:hypothetical protein
MSMHSSTGESISIDGNDDAVVGYGAVSLKDKRFALLKKPIDVNTLTWSASQEVHFNAG